jgi:DNA-binding transcriptional ArsR family regulator
MNACSNNQNKGGAMVKSEKDCASDDICDVRVIHADKVKHARDSALPDARLQKFAMICRLLGDPTRLKILMALKQAEMCVCDIAAFMDMTESAVSHQLRRLRDMSAVKRRRQGQVLYYSLNEPSVHAFLDFGIAHAE